MSLYDLSRFLGTDTTGDGYGPLYTNWEKDSVYGCNCDWTYAGPDCSQRLCPKGDDPETTSQGSRSIRITTANSASQAMSGSFTLWFNGFSTVFNADGSAESSNACVSFMQALNNVETVTCTQSSLDATTKGCIYTIVFTKWGDTPMENNLHSNDGNPGLSQFYCDKSRVTAASGTISCTLADITGGTEGTTLTEYETCSSRGICDFATGICACATGYEGRACEAVSSIIENPCSNPDLTVHASCGSFTGAALQVKSTKAKNTDFDLILASASTTNLFAVRGDGRTRIYEGGLIVSEGGQTVVAGGLVVTAGGATVTAGGLAVVDGGGSISSTSANTPVLTVHASETGSAYTSDVLHVKSTRVSNTAFNLVKATASSTDLFMIRGDGRVNVVQGGLLVTAGGATVLTGGVHVSGGMTIHTNGLRVDKGGATISAGGLTVVEGGTTVTNTATSTSALTVHASDATSGFTSAALTLKATRAGNAAFKLLDALVDVGNTPTSMFNVDGTGKATAAAGFVSTSGGGTISAGGLHVYAGATIHTGGLNVVSTGATVTAGGLTVVDGGGEIASSAAGSDVATIRASSASMSESVLHLKADRSSSLSSLNMIKTT
jgi:hypothetical protein